MTPLARKSPHVGGAVWTRAPATSSRQIRVHGERFFGDGDDTEQEEDDDDDDGAKEDEKEEAADGPPKKRWRKEDPGSDSKDLD